MASLPQVARTIQHVLTTVPEEAARSSGFCQRRSKLSAAHFVQALVLGWLAQPQASLSELAQRAAKAGAPISPQGLAQRFTPAAATLLEQVLSAALAAVIRSEPVAVPLLRRFTAVLILDSTTIGLPDALAGRWAGCGGRVATRTQAALKLTVGFDLLRGGLSGLWPRPGRAQDKTSALQHARLPKGALRLTDLGFWSLPVLRQIAAEGAFFLSRLHLQTVVLSAAGTRLDLPTWLAGQGRQVDESVQLGVSARLPARLLAVRVPQAVADTRRRKLRAAAKREGRTPSTRQLALTGWTLLVTNVPPDRLSVAEALVLARARWQIELLFKLWKEHGHLDESRSADPERVVCEVYAKLIAMVIQHWALLVGCWRHAARSLVRAAATVRHEAPCLLSALGSVRRLTAALRDLRRCLDAGCRLTTRRRRPNLHQLLLDPTLGGLA